MFIVKFYLHSQLLTHQRHSFTYTFSFLFDIENAHIYHRSEATHTQAANLKTSENTVTFTPYFLLP